MATLSKCSFLEINGVSGSWSIHNCIHDWTVAILNKDLDITHYWYNIDCVYAFIAGLDDERLAHISLSPVSRHAVRLSDERFFGHDMMFNPSTDRLDKVLGVSLLLR